MNTPILLNVPATSRNRDLVNKTHHPIHRESIHDGERARQLADIANENNYDAAECAAADLSREFPGSLA